MSEICLDKDSSNIQNKSQNNYINESNRSKQRKENKNEK